MPNVFKNEDIKLTVHIRQGQYYDLTKSVSQVTWSGDIKSPSRTLDFTFIQAVNDKKVKKIGLVVNSTVCFYVANKEIFRGQVIDVDTSSNNNSVKITAKDIGFFLTKDEVNFNFNNVSASDIAKAIFKGKDGQPSLPVGKIASGFTKMTKIFTGATRYDAIMTAYTEHSKKSKEHKKYMIEVDIDKFNVIEKGVVTLKIEFDETKNVEHTSYKESIDKLINRVLVVNDSGNKIKAVASKELKYLYKYYITKVVEQKKDEVLTDKEIKANFQGLEKNCSLSGFGDITCKAGYKVQVKDSFTGLIGEFYIDRDKHTWVGGKYNIDLDLNFDNIMDEKSADKQESKKNAIGSGTGKDWGHGVTIAQLNKVLKGPLKGRAEEILRLANAYGFNPMLALLIMKMESGNGLNSGLAKKYNNFGGIGPIKGYKTVTIKNHKYAVFPDISTGLEEQFRLLGKVYINDRKKRTIEDIIQIYAPKSDGNNTTQYISSMKKWYKDYTGVDWKPNLIGTGVQSVEIAKKRISEALTEYKATDSAAGHSIVREAIKYEGRSGMQSFAWCCWFAQKAMKDAGIKPIVNTNSSLTFYNAYKSSGKAGAVGTYVPKAGDTIFFDTGWVKRVPNHVGIVTKVTGTGMGLRIHTIEGNNGNKVKRCSYGVFGAKKAKIIGYGIN